MNDFIRKKEALSMLCYTQCEIRNEDGKQCEWPCLAYTKFANIPAEDVVERKKGEWHGVLIKGMMMLPANCQTCPISNRAWLEVTSEGELRIDLRCGITKMLAENPYVKRNKDCPLEEVKE